MSFARNSGRFRHLASRAQTFFAAAITSAALVHCVGDDPTAAPTVDAGDVSDASVQNDSAASGDASIDAGPTSCAWDKTFGTPVPLPGIPTDAVEGHPSLSPNELTIYFHGFGGSLSDSSTGDDLYVATRASIADPFGTPSKLAISTNGSDQNASVTSDHTTLYYDFTAADGGASALWVAQKGSLPEFNNPHALGSPPASPQAGVTVSDGQPFITADDVELWFTSRRDGGTGAVDIYSSLLSGGSFGAPIEEALLNSTFSEYAPSLSFDRLTVYFSSGRPSGLGGADDIWRSHRSTVADAFPAPSPVAELNSPANEFGGWLSPDNCRFYFETRRAASGLNNIYLAERTP
jgi:hypothetical protein